MKVLTTGGGPTSVKNTDLRDLVAHAECVPADLSLGRVVDQLGRTTVSYVAVKDGNRVVGVLSRETIGLLFGGRYGFALFAEEPVTSKLEPDFLAFRRSADLIEVLNAALNREKSAFPIDVVLLDDRDRYLGMIPIHRLAQLQSRLLEEHVEELEREKERYRDLVENASDIIFTIDMSGHYLSLNKAGERLTGYTQEEAKGTSIFEVIAPEHHELVRQMTRQKLDGSPRTTYEVDILVRDGRRLTLEVSSRLILEDSKPVGIHGVARDITERRLSEERLRQSALHDALTGLPNRALFFSHLEAATERIQRRQESHFAVLLLDLDRFKVVNDSLGHMAGDRLLVAIAERLKRCVRGADIVARFGGDEFTVLLTEISSPQEAVHVTERILAAFTEPLHIDGHDIFTSASIGIALSYPEGKSEDFLRDADIAMYRAKFSGKARYQLYDPEMHRGAANRLTIETDLRQGLDRNEFELHYQPIISLASETIVEFEALVRWRHPVRGLVGPSEFIPVAEETGLIIPLGRWVLREACTQLRKWQDQEFHDGSLVMSVNLSGKQFAQRDLADDVAQILRETGVAPNSLNLEITESAIVENAEAAHATLSRLKELGVRISTDDFGTGYSSLSYLYRFPIDRLKIDRSFIRDMQTHGENAEIVRTIVMLGSSLGLQVVAEGVEDAEQLAFLRELRCPYAQGFFFSEPVPHDVAAALLAAITVA